MGGVGCPQLRPSDNRSFDCFMGVINVPRKRRKCRVEFLPPATYYKPAGVPLRELEEVALSVEEFEALRLKDMEGLEQIQCAERMGVARTTYQRILYAAREKITSSDCLNMTITFPGGSGSITSITDFFPTLNRERITEKQSILSAGTADYDDMVARNGILVAEDTAKIGDTLKIAGRSPDGSTFDIEAVVVGTYNRADLMKNSPVIPGSPYFIMTYDTAKKLTGITEQTGVLSLEVSEEYFEDVLSTVQKIADENGKIEVNTIEQTIASIQKYYSPSIKTFYMISAILFVFGVISLMNMLMVDFQNRKREFGLLEAVGTTQNQLKAMLNREIGIYLWGSLAISLIGGNIFSIIVCGRLDASNHCITLQLPWIFLVALVAVLIAIYLVFSMYAKSELKKTSILSAIREN
jgi:predicted DNA-binding protein (UPF0251 family)